MRTAALTVAMLLAGVPAGAATIENFQVKTAADLAALCSADPGSDKYVAAIHFCQGFGVGAWQYYKAQSGDDPTAEYVCVPSPPPTRNEAMAGFVAWVRAHPEHQSGSAVDGLFRYLADTYPCGR